MALITCPECGNQISEKATACIHCGFPLSELTIEETVVAETDNVVEEVVSEDVNTFVPDFKVLVNCKYCGAEVSSDDIFCYSCGKLVNPEKYKEQRLQSIEETRKQGEIISLERVKMQEQIAQIQHEKEMKTQRMIQEQEVADLYNTARCPKCGSTSLTSHKKGYGIGKGIAVTALTGNALGLVAGNIGRNKVRVTCMKCGHQFKLK